MLRKLKFLLCLLCLSVCCSSCFEIVEEINMKQDGSGDMTVTINLSQSKTKVASILLMDSINGYKVPNKQKIQQQINDAVVRLRKMPGISNVKSTTDFNNYIVSFSLSFKELSNVNNISRTILEEQKAKITNVSTYSYNKATGIFARDYKYAVSARTEYNKMKKEDREVFQTAGYTSICRFPVAVTRSSNPLARISKSQKAVMQKCSILDLINGKVSLSNQVQLSK